MIVLGLDAGANFGWCKLEWLDQRYRWIDGGSFRAEEFDDRMVRALGGTTAELAAIEGPSGHLYEHARGKHLLEASKLAGRAYQRCVDAGVAAVEISAPAWRKALCGNAHASNAFIKSVLERLVCGMPRTNEHARDAAGAACIAARMWVGRKSA